MKSKMFVLSIGILILFSVACTKEGPQGPPGPQGSQGQPGPAGPAGGTGATGTANVIYSDWFEFTASEWADTTLPLTPNRVRRAIKLAPGITQNVINQGMILSYFRLSPTEGVIPMPFLFNSNGSYHFYNLFDVGKVIYALVNRSGNASGSFNAQFRYIIIPGGVSGGRLSEGAVADHQKLSYEEVLKLYKIPPAGKNFD
jgi:hypothetical protein